MRNDVAINPRGLFTKPFKEACCKKSFAFSVSFRLAILGSDDFLKVFFVLNKEVEDASNDASTLTT
ncbi:hypothetical protein ColTof3_01864 [Colletotrichum tofieldiae]|nr:hypothetical protein ColTof3_01864 [Colletotrichum tofieldiae]